MNFESMIVAFADFRNIAAASTSALLFVKVQLIMLDPFPVICNTPPSFSVKPFTKLMFLKATFVPVTLNMLARPFPSIV